MSQPRSGPDDPKPPQKGPAEPGDPGEGRELVLDRKPKIERPMMYRVVFHNDDYTTMEFVVWILKQVFRKTDSEATHLMLTIHHKGSGVAGVFTRDIAETKVSHAKDLAKEQGMPLMVTAEPDD